MLVIVIVIVIDFSLKSQLAFERCGCLDWRGWTRANAVSLHSVVSKQVSQSWGEMYANLLDRLVCRISLQFLTHGSLPVEPASCLCCGSP